MASWRVKGEGGLPAAFRAYGTHKTKPIKEVAIWLIAEYPTQEAKAQ